MTALGTLCTRQWTRLGKGLQISQFRAAPSKWLTTSSCLRGVEPLNPEENFWDKNKRLNRPTSPHLTIYQPQITWVLSITHRGTGVAMSSLLSGFAIGMLALPHGFPHYFALLSSSTGGMAGIFAVKFILAFPFMFHFANGIRHLAWDMGKGFQLNQLYNSGYAVLATSLLFSLGAAAV